MILDLDTFVSRERPYWEELERAMDFRDRVERETFDLKEARRFYYLYQRASSDLAKLQTFASEPELSQYLQNLVGKAYMVMQSGKEKRTRIRPFRWFLQTCPQTFRRRSKAFAVSLLVSFLGVLFGCFVLNLDRDNKNVIYPPQFSHLLDDPSKRVAEEEAAHSAGEDRLAGQKESFSASLMQNNIRVTIRAMAWGIVWGIGTIVVLFYNGVILGGVFFEYVAAGESLFLAGWLLPHGVPELTAIFIGGQAGLVLGRAVIGWGTNRRLRSRLRAVRSDIVTLIGLAAVLLVWAGFVEAYLSQYHEPVIPYVAKIGFGLAELAGMSFFFGLCGRAGSTGSDHRKEEGE